MSLTRRRLVQTAPMAAMVLASPAMLSQAGAILPIVGKRFKFAKTGGPPALWNALKVVDLTSGTDLTKDPRGVTEANAEEGWYERYLFDADQKLIREGDYAKTERIDADILITYGEDLDLPEESLAANSLSDVEAGVLYDEDITDDERAWLENGKPVCPQCGEYATTHPDRLCLACDPASWA